MTTEVQLNADAITDDLQRIGDVNFAGGMERQAATLGGAFSNAQDAAADLASTIGNILSPTLIALTRDVSESVAQLGYFLRAIDRMSDGTVGNAVVTVTDLADRFNTMALLSALQVGLCVHSLGFFFARAFLFTKSLSLYLRVY